MKKKILYGLISVLAVCISLLAFSACGEPTQYLVTWQDWDGTVLSTNLVKEGIVPTYNGLTPTKEADDQYTYEFSGWDKEIAPVTADIVYIAQFNATLRSYNVVWQNWDGTVLQEGKVTYGESPAYTGDAPTKQGDEQYTYTFSGWDPVVNPVCGDVTYVAQFTSEENCYDITWLNWDGSLLGVSIEYRYGATPVYMEWEFGTPRKEADSQYSYVFSGWSPTIEKVTGPATYTAQFTPVVNQYTVYWKNWNGSYLEVDENVDYGTIPVYDGITPAKPSDTIGDYTFIGWSPSVEEVTGNTTYVAQFSVTLKKYTVTWKLQDLYGTVLEFDEDVEYGTIPTYNGETPTQAKNAQYTYIFVGWTSTYGATASEIKAITGNTTYYAVFTTELNKYTVTWTNWDGSVLEVDEDVPYDTMPTYDGATPTQAGDAQYYYEFYYWSPTIQWVTGDVTYVAVFLQKTNTYTVTWKNWDGTVLKIDEIKYGRTPSYVGEEPTKTGTDTAVFDFVGWDRPCSAVEGDQTYVAVFNEVLIYQVKYNLAGGTASDIENSYKRVNDIFILTSTVPTKNGYRFVGWNNVHESRVYTPGDRFSGNFDVEFYAIWEKCELCDTCSGNGYTSSMCTACDGKGAWDARCTGGFMSNGYHYSGTECSNCGTNYGFVVINGIGNVCSSCYNRYGVIYRGQDVRCTSCDGKGTIHRTCGYCNALGYTTDTCASCAGSAGSFEPTPTLSYKTTTKVCLVYIGGYEYSMDGQNWQTSPLFENLNANTSYVFYQRRATAGTVPFGPTSTALTVTTDDYYSVTYILNGGSAVDSNPGYYTDASEIELLLPRKTGYTSLGWYDADGNKVDVLGNGMCGNIVLYAKWNDGNIYTVSFADGTFDPITVQYGKEYSLPTPIKDGYNFKNWADTAQYDSYGVIASQGVWTYPRDMEVSSSWNLVIYNVNYILNGGTYSYGQARYSYNVETQTFTLTYPQKTGYRFVGWTYKGQDTPVLDVTITQGTMGDKEFTAHWTALTYTLTLDSNGGEVGEESVNVTYNEEYELPTPTRTGYTFVGWYNGDTKYSSGTWRGTEEITLVAEWVANEYNLTYGDTKGSVNVTFDYNYSESVSDTVNLRANETLNRPQDPARSGYVFTGWYTDSSCTVKYPFYGTIDADMTLYAGWEKMNMPNVYSEVQIDPSLYNSSNRYALSTARTSESCRAYVYLIARESGSHTIVWSNSNSLNSTAYGYYLQIYNATTDTVIQDYIFHYDNSYGYSSFTCSAGDIIVIGLYRYSASYTSTAYINFSGFNALAPSTARVKQNLDYYYEEGTTHVESVEYDKSYTLPTPIREHYTFLGWYNGTEKVESGDWKIAADTVLVAKWARDEYTITYNLDGGKNAPSNPSHYGENDEIILEAPTKTGYVFLGWTGSNGDVPQVDVSFSGTVRCDLEYTAHWEVAVFTVDYVMNGGTNPAKNPTAITVFDAFELKEPTRTGYTFKGWYLDDAFTLPISSLTNITSDLTLYACFVANRYSSTFVSEPVGDKITIQLRHGEGVNTVTHYTISNGDSFNPYDHIIIHENYIFGGWYLNESCTKRVTGDLVLYSDTTIYAKRIYCATYDQIPADGRTLTAKQTYSTAFSDVAYYVPDNACRIYIKTVALYGYSAKVERWREGYGYATLTYVTSSADTQGEVEGYFDVRPGDVLYFYNSCSKIGSAYGWSEVRVVETYSATVSFGPYSASKTIDYDSKVPDASVLGSGCIADRVGYRFVGWVDEDGVMCGETWNFLENKTFTAKWELVDYTIEYVLDGAENSPNNPDHYNVTDYVILEAITKEGYTFEGWYSDSEFTQQVKSLKYTTENRTLYAKFTPNSYNATLDFDGGTSSPTITFISDGESEQLLFTGDDNFSSYYPKAKDGYAFGGWYLDESCQTVFDFSAVITEDITLYAKWISSDATYHKITVNEIETESITVNGTNEIRIAFIPLASGEITVSTSSALDVQGILYDENMVRLTEADDISEENYNFSITYSVEAGKQYTIAIKGATTLTKGDCDVLFGFDGSMGISGTTYTSFAFDAVYDAHFDLPTPTKEGYVFLGWSDENGNKITSSTWTYAQDMILYAQWGAIG